MIDEKTGKKICSWCRDEIKKGRTKYCSDICYQKVQALINCRKTIFERDGGVCQKCGADCNKLQYLLDHFWAVYRRFEYIQRKVEQGESIEKSLGAHARGYWIAKQEDIAEYQLLVNDLDGFRNNFPEYSRKLKSGVSRPKVHHAFEIDHIQPICKGGTSTSCNLELKCMGCHLAKSQEDLKK